MEKSPCNDQFVETELGTRALNKQNNNKTIVVPRVALENCNAINADKLKVSLVQTTNGNKFIKLSVPNSKSSEPEDIQEEKDDSKSS